MIRRWEWLSQLVRMNEWTHGLEIGVLYGQNLTYLLQHNPELSMIGIDSWKITSAYRSQALLDEYKRSAYLIQDLYPGRLRLYTDTSDNVAPSIPEDSLDFVFIDGSHEYKQVMRDIRNYSPKLRGEGLLCGHDYGHSGVYLALHHNFPESEILVSGIDGCWCIKNRDCWYDV